jgi:adenylate cyclase
MSTRRIGSMPPADAWHGLRVHYVLTGSCAVVGTRLLLALELVFTGEQRVVWSRSVGTTLDALVADPAAVLGDVGKGVMEAIESHETGRAHSLPLASLDSYSLMLGGLRLMHRLSRSSFERSREVFDELVTRHPRHPDGYAWLAKWHILQLHQGWSADPQASAAMARDMARRALDHDDRCVVAMIVSGMVRTFNERRLDEAERIYTNALESHPNEALGWLLKGMVHAFRGEGELAVAHTRHASELTPLDPMRYYYDSLGASAEASAGHYDRAIELAQRSLKANSMHASTLRILTIAYAMSDQLDAARGVVKRMRDVEPDFTVSRFLQRSPSSDFEVGRRFADALARAGVPP